MTRRVLVAGIGNIFLGDDGFGVEVARRLAGEALPAGVEVADFGIRGVHLAYELLDGCELTILVDAAPRGEAPGTVYVIEPDLEPAADAAALARDLTGGALIDAHGMEPESVLALLRALGGEVGRVLVVGCEPADTGERMGLTEPVALAVDEAVRVIRELVAHELGGRNGHEPRRPALGGRPHGGPRGRHEPPGRDPLGHDGKER
jgi:hydrogenase maturation protease